MTSPPLALPKLELSAPPRNPSPGSSFMTPERINSYRENGFLVFPDALLPGEVEALRSETLAICRGQRGLVGGGMIPDDSSPEADVLRRYLCIHFPHKISDLMFQALAHPAIVEVLKAVISPNVKCMQSMLFIKAAGKPGQAWHQDELYIPTRDRSLTGAWIALDEATIENGCLWVIPGSHKHGILWPQHQPKDARFDCAWESFDFPYSDKDAVPVEVKADSVVFFNGYLLHRSLPNRAKGGYRRALVNHYMSAESLLPWLNGVDYRDIVMVAGKDPYAYRGIQNVSAAHIRPSGEGGCGTPKRNLD